MANRLQLIQQIKFNLSQLGSQNSHHEFEHLCRHLTRARICSNILPATGPVSAGGDQGADFETFRSSVGQVFGSSSFIELNTSEKVIFSCSIQKKNLKKKSKDDIKKIVDKNLKPDRVVYFTTQPVAVGLRHQIQSWAKNELDVSVEIHDLESIAELLADADTFWIAAEYLKIPPELLPVTIGRKLNWYGSLKEIYISNDKELVFNFAELIEIKRAVRAATFEQDLKVDLPSWFAILKKITESASPPLVRLARYELAVAALRGRDDAELFSENVKQLFAEGKELTDHRDVENLNTLLLYSIAAVRRGILHATAEMLNEYRKVIKEQFERLLITGVSESARLEILENQGTLEFFNERLEVDLKFEKTIKIWNTLVPQISKNALYPAERFSDRVTNLIEISGGSEGLDQIAAKLDDILALRAGRSVAAEKRRDRALIYFENRNIIKAIDLLHEAKIQWFQNETIKGSLISIILIGSWYSKIGLAYAAKYYFMAAFKVAFNDKDERLKRYLPDIVEELAACDYQAGNWVNFLNRSELFMMVYSMFNSDPSRNLFLDKASSRIAAHISLLSVATEKVNPGGLSALKTLLSVLRNDSFFDEAREAAKNALQFQNADELKHAIERDLIDIPFSDAGPVRKIIWHQSGLKFQISFQNAYENATAGETLAAMLQAVLCDLSSIEMRFIPGQVRIDLKVIATADKIEIKELPSNEMSLWEVKWPTTDVHFDDGIVAALFQILGPQSANTMSRMMKILEDRFAAGLVNKLFVVNSYKNLTRDISEPEKYLSEARLKLSPFYLAENFEHKVHKELKWDDKLDSLYDKDESLKAVQRRYDRSLKTIKFTLPRLCAEPDFLKTIDALRAEGWVDWQIIAAVATTTINERMVNRKHPRTEREAKEMSRAFQDLMTKDELPDLPMPPLSSYSQDLLRNALLMNLISTLKGHGLELRKSTPNLEGINTFMTNKFRVRDDDVEHPDYFRSSIRKNSGDDGSQP